MFDGIIGNERIIDMFRNPDYELRNTYIFYGNEGVGKFTIAKELATAKSEYNQNILIIDSDKDVAVDDIRSIEDFIYRPPFGKDNRRTVIINNSQTMSVICQNMLLKLLENPPEFALFILICSDVSSLLDTVKSRAFLLQFYPPNRAVVRETLSKTVKDSGLLEFITVVIDGSIAKILSVKDDLAYYQRLFSCCVEMEKLKNTKYIYSVHQMLMECNLKEIIAIYRWYSEQCFALVRQNMESDKYYQYSKILEKTVKYIESTNDYALAYDIMLLKICKFNSKK